MKVKSITDPDVRKMNEAEMVEAVVKDMGKMEAGKGSLSESRIKASVDYFRGFLQYGIEGFCPSRASAVFNPHAPQQRSCCVATGESVQCRCQSA